MFLKTPTASGKTLQNHLTPILLKFEPMIHLPGKSSKKTTLPLPKAVARTPQKQIPSNKAARIQF
jgi:hypothetical protein